MELVADAGVPSRFKHCVAEKHIKILEVHAVYDCASGLNPILDSETFEAPFAFCDLIELVNIFLGDVSVSGLLPVKKCLGGQLALGDDGHGARLGMDDLSKVTWGPVMGKVDADVHGVSDLGWHGVLVGGTGFNLSGTE